ncbi:MULTISPECIES: hypothetical protein [unclassified Streptomyces]|uniref:hypothetical protein n=1 Tax=unclassified Streptomyces TaxID=2593676 RepID=UPI00364745C1
MASVPRSPTNCAGPASTSATTAATTAHLTTGGLEGQRGCFTRDASGAVVGVDLAGRLFTRADPTAG